MERRLAPRVESVVMNDSTYREDNGRMKERRMLPRARLSCGKATPRIAPVSAKTGREGCRQRFQKRLIFQKLYQAHTKLSFRSSWRAE